MKSDNAILEKSYAFSKRIILLYKKLLADKQPRPLADQILRSGTSIGANVEEAVGGFSRRDFAAKLGIAYKEAREVNYWLRLLRDTECLDVKLADSFVHDSEELKRILAAIILSSRTPPKEQIQTADWESPINESELNRLLASEPPADYE